MAVCVHRLGHQVTAADASGARLAVSTPEHRVELYSWPAGTHQAQVLDAEHEAPIAGLDFSSTAAPAAAACGAAAPLRLVSASHDRNAYVWTESSTTSNGSSSASTQLRPELVITRLAKAALCCAWAPGSLKFALGASERAAAVCYLDAERELWAPRLIKKKHGSAVMVRARGCWVMMLCAAWRCAVAIRPIDSNAAGAASTRNAGGGVAPVWSTAGHRQHRRQAAAVQRCRARWVGVERGQ